VPSAPWHPVRVKHSELLAAVTDTFGSAHGRSLMSDLVLVALGGRTAEGALREGVAPQRVWDALCAEMELSDDVRWRHRGTLDRRRPS